MVYTSLLDFFGIKGNIFQNLAFLIVCSGLLALAATGLIGNKYLYTLELQTVDHGVVLDWYVQP